MDAVLCRALLGSDRRVVGTQSTAERLRFLD